MESTARLHGNVLSSKNHSEAKSGVGADPHSLQLSPRSLFANHIVICLEHRTLEWREACVYDSVDY